MTLKTALVTLALTAATGATPLLGAGPDAAPASQPAAALPDSYFKAVPGMDRFRDGRYLTALAGDGILSADPQALYGRLAAAVQAGETYKALYLARVFTVMQPGNATGWANRAKLAGALGFVEEAKASQANAQNGTSVAVAGAALPGALHIRPVSLGDWAAALALTADDLTAREGRPVAMAVRDDLSGVEVASAEDVARQNRGPWATAKPVLISDVLPNLVAVPAATPMDRKSINGGMFALGAMAMAGSTYSTSLGATDAATQLAELTGNAMAKAFEVPSEFKGGTYAAVTYTNGLPRQATMTPRTAGKHEAVGTPLTLLWATGPSLVPAVRAAWINGDSKESYAMKVDGKTKKPEWKKQAVPSLLYFRAQQFCDADRCSAPLALFEVMLTNEDVQALFPGLEANVPAVQAWRDRYAAGRPFSIAAAGVQYAGFDAAGITYVTRHKPTEWLITTAAPRSK